MGGSDDEFICDDGETIPMNWVNDGVDDCEGGEDEYDMGDGNDHGDDDGHDHGDDHDEMWTFHREMSECDSDADGMVDFDELDACVTMDIANDGYGDDGVDGLRWMFDLVDADEDGMLDSDEFEDFAEMTSGEPMMVCYDRYADEIDLSCLLYTSPSPRD